MITTSPQKIVFTTEPEKLTITVSPANTVNAPNWNRLVDLVATSEIGRAIERFMERSTQTITRADVNAELEERLEYYNRMSLDPETETLGQAAVKAALERNRPLD